LWFFSRSSTTKFNHVLAIDHVYGGINLLKYFYILATNPRTHCRIISLNFWNLKFLVFLVKKSFVNVDGPFLCLKNDGNSPPKKNSVTSLIFILMFSKKLDKFYDYFKDWALKNSKTFYVGIVYVSKVEMIRIIFKNLFIRSNFLFKFVISNFSCKQYFPWICTILSIFFWTRIAKLGKFETNKNMLVGEGSCWGHNPTTYITFTSAKIIKVKYILRSLIIYIVCFFLKVV